MSELLKPASVLLSSTVISFVLLFLTSGPLWFVGILSPTGFYIQGLNYEAFFSLPLVCVCTHKTCRMTMCYIYLVRQGKERGSVVGKVLGGEGSRLRKGL